MTWVKIGNRYYDEIDSHLYKATYDEVGSEYVGCGDWAVADFLSAGSDTLDANSFIEKANIISEFSLE